MKTFQSFLIVVCVSVLVVLNTNAQAKTSAENWATTGLKFEAFQQVLSEDQGCYSEQKIFVACVQSINSLLASLNPPLELRADDRPVQNIAMGQKIFGPLFVTEKTPIKFIKDEPFFMRREREKKERARIQAALEAAYLLKNKVSFSELLTWTYDEVIAPRPPYQSALLRESELVGKAFNTYFSIRFDPHTIFMPKEAFNDMRSDISVSLAGIGAIIKLMNGKFSVSNLAENGPAHHAGLYAKDIITHLDGVSVEGLSFGQMLSQVRGPIGSRVELTVLRKNKISKITITRGLVVEKNIESKMLSRGNKRYAYIQLRSFMEKKGCDKVESALKELLAQGAQGVVLDLRNNTGGSLDQGVCLTSLFLGFGKKVLEVRSLTDKKNIETHYADRFKVTNLPMVTLINELSASSSEIVAGALQDHQRSIIVGTRSFGKGTVQSSGSLKAYENIVYLHTLAQFYLPSGRTNQIVGVMPDIALLPTPFLSGTDMVSTREEDLYTNALPPTGAPWVQPRPLAITKLKNCTKQNGTALADYLKADEFDALAPDFQVLYAQDVLNCLAR